MSLTGIIVPIVTPFDSTGALDPAAIPPLVDFLAARGIAGIFPAGTTGEGFLLSLAERRTLAETVIAAAAGRLPVIVHTGCPTTADAIDLTRHAQRSGATAAALLPPYVYRHTDAALLDHFTAVATAVPDLPILLYHYPAISNNALSLPLVLELRRRAPNIIGMKDSSGSLDLLIRLKRATNGTFLSYSGGDGQVLMAAAAGLDGCISGNANVVPELLVALFAAATAGDVPRARLLQHQLDQVRDLLGDGSDLSLFKHMLARRNLPVGDVRPPLRPIDPTTAHNRWRHLHPLLFP